MNKINKFTDAAVRNIKEKDKREDYTEGNGFCLRVTPKGVKSWVYSYKFNGQSKRLTIGHYPAISVAEARKLCSDAQLLKDKGIDPSQLKKDESDKKNIERTNTLSYYLAHQYKDHMERAIAQDSYLALIRNHFPDLLEKSLSDINKDDLIAWRKIQMNKYYNDEKGYASASIGSRYSALKSLMSYAVRNKVIQSNPFDLMEKLEFSKDESTKQQAKRTYLTKEQQKSLLLSITNYDEKLRSERRNSRSHGQSHLPDLDNLAFASHHKPMLLIHFYMGLRGGRCYQLRVGSCYRYSLRIKYNQSFRKNETKNKNSIYPSNA